MDVGAAVGADLESATGVEPGEGAFDDPAFLSEPGAVRLVAAGDLRFDLASLELASSLLGVVGAVCVHTCRPPAQQLLDLIQER